MNYNMVINKLRLNGIINDDNSLYIRYKRTLDQQPELIQMILNATTFLRYSAPISVRIRCIINGIKDQPVCTTCGDVTKMRTNGRYMYTFPKFCSSKCFSGLNEVNQKRASTNLEKYGVTNPIQNQTVKQKKNNTMIERYGVENGFVAGSDIREKARRTMIERYNVTVYKHLL